MSDLYRPETFIIVVSGVQFEYLSAFQEDLGIFDLHVDGKYEGKRFGECLLICTCVYLHEIHFSLSRAPSSVLEKVREWGLKSFMWS